MEYNLYLDDSGGLHPNSPSDFFIYGGFLIPSSNAEGLGRKVAFIKKKLFRTRGEVKASDMNDSHQRFVVKGTKDLCYPVFAVINIPKLKSVDFSNHKKVTRYKNFAIRCLIGDLAKKNLLQGCTKLNVYIDNQSMAVESRDSLEDYLYNYFVHEAYLSQFVSPFGNDIQIDFKVDYKDSKYNNLIQLADVYANVKYRRFTKSKVGASGSLEMKSMCLKLPHNIRFSSGC